jgi:septal ring factor EnvC (AmiA/AmiB activator)
VSTGYKFKLTATQSPEDQSRLNPSRSTKRKRHSPSDPDYVDSDSEKKNTRSTKKLKEVEGPEAKLKKKSRELASERGNNTKLRKTNELLREEIKQLQAKVKKEQQQKQQNSRQYAKKLKAAPVVAEDESVLRQSLKKLGQTCARWAESYAKASGSDHDLSQEQSQNILEVLKTYQAISLEGQELIFLEQKCREILLNAILAHLVYVEILARPFYFFQHALDIGGPKNVEENLVWLHKFTSAGWSPTLQCMMLPD